MKGLDPRLLKRLEERDDANQVLAEALGVCPTCGQAMPRYQARRVPGTPTKPKREKWGRVRDSIIEYLHADTAYGNQSRCARQLGIKATYVNKVWNDYQRGSKRQARAPAAGREAVIAWLRDNPGKSQSDCARHLGVTRQYVSIVAGGALPRDEANE